MHSMRNFKAALKAEEDRARVSDTGPYVGPDGAPRFRYRRFVGVRSGSTTGAGNIIGMLPDRATVLLDEGTFLGEQLALEVTRFPERECAASDSGDSDGAGTAGQGCRGRCCVACTRGGGACTRGGGAYNPFPGPRGSALGATGAHVRRCVVVQGCEVRGLERMQVAPVVWGRFVASSAARIAWGWASKLITCHWARAAARRRPALLSEAVIERLLRVNAGALNDRGNSARFDELRREIRLIVVRRRRSTVNKSALGGGGDLKVGAAENLLDQVRKSMHLFDFI